MAIAKEEMLDAVGAMSVLQLNALVKAFEEQFGVSATALAVAAPAGGAAAPAAEEQTEFTVVLVEAGGNKGAVIKDVREITRLGLKEPTDLADAQPKPSKENAPKAEPEEIKKK